MKWDPVFSLGVLFAAVTGFLLSSAVTNKKEPADYSEEHLYLPAGSKLTKIEMRNVTADGRTSLHCYTRNMAPGEQAEVFYFRPGDIPGCHVSVVVYEKIEPPTKR